MASDGEEKGRRVCVTGANGYVASWLVKLLLSKGYIVHGTVRDTGDDKNAHLQNLEGAPENLKLFQADLLNHNALCEAITGCTGVFHVASPVPSYTLPKSEVEFLEPALTGTLNVLKACSETKVKRVVVVSSIAAVGMNPNWPKDQVMDEACWSDKEYCKDVKNWYCLSKTVAEAGALEYAKTTGLDVVTLCPCLVIGPLLHSSVNESNSIFIKMLTDGLTVENKVRKLVDVRNVAEALLLIFEKPDANGRYLCVAYIMRLRDLVEKLRSMYPNFNYPKGFIEVGEDEQLSSEKLQKLGWKYKPLEETLADSVKSYQDIGVLDKIGLHKAHHQLGS